MTIKNVTASVKQRLLNLSRERGEEFNLLLIRYGIERFLYRLSQLEEGEMFVLKGAVLFHLWGRAPYRPTRDVDLLGRGTTNPSGMADLFRRVCQVRVEDDGLTFDTESVHAERLREQEEYEGLRMHVTARLGTARINLQVDVGFGDAITPGPTTKNLPCLLDFPSPRMRVYPWETVVAEKYQALVELGMTNSRMKDFFDLRYMAKEFAFDGAKLAQAIQATFARRHTELPTTRPTGLASRFVENETVKAGWKTFLRRSRLEDPGLGFRKTTDEIWDFLKPVTEAVRAGAAFDKKWTPGGPWVSD